MHVRLSAALLLLSSGVSAFNYTIGVGKNETNGIVTGIGFDPSRTVIASGDPNFIIFDFFSGPHRVVQSSFDAPCVASSGFDTQEIDVPAGTESGGPTFVFPVTDSSEVLWFSDIAGTNCQQGAIFCVNSDEGSTTSCSAFKTAALALGSTSSSSSSSSSTSPSSSSTASAPSTPSTSSGTATETGSDATTSQTGTSGAGRIGGVAGAAIALVGMAAALFL